MWKSHAHPAKYVDVNAQDEVWVFAIIAWHILNVRGMFQMDGAMMMELVNLRINIWARIYGYKIVHHTDAMSHLIEINYT